MEVTYDYVDLETAKLLKELGFDVPCQTTYNEEGEVEDCINYTDSILFTADDVNNALLNDFLVYLRPEHWQVLKWLRLKYALHIQTPFSYNDPKPYCWIIDKIDEPESNQNCWMSDFDNNLIGWDTPEEARLNAIEAEQVTMRERLTALELGQGLLNEFNGDAFTQWAEEFGNSLS